MVLRNHVCSLKLEENISLSSLTVSHCSNRNICLSEKHCILMNIIITLMLHYTTATWDSYIVDIFIMWNKPIFAECRIYTDSATRESVVLVIRSCLEVFICITSVVPYDRSSIVFLYFYILIPFINFLWKLNQNHLLVNGAGFTGWMASTVHNRNTTCLFYFQHRLDFSFMNNSDFLYQNCFFVCAPEILLETLIQACKIGLFWHFSTGFILLYVYTVYLLALAVRDGENHEETCT